MGKKVKDLLEAEESEPVKKSDKELVERLLELMDIHLGKFEPLAFFEGKTMAKEHGYILSTDGDTWYLDGIKIKQWLKDKK